MVPALPSANGRWSLERESIKVVMAPRQRSRTSIDDGGGAFERREFPPNNAQFTRVCFPNATVTQISSLARCVVGTRSSWRLR